MARRRAAHPLTLLLARARADHVAALIVGGRVTARDGRPAGFDLGALERRLAGHATAGLPEPRATVGGRPRRHVVPRDYDASGGHRSPARR